MRFIVEINKSVTYLQGAYDIYPDAKKVGKSSAYVTQYLVEKVLLWVECNR